jgi:hypothetical protein
LVAAQAPSGAWFDYAFALGPSDEWVTSYVGACLAGAMQAIDGGQIASAVARARTWLAAGLRLRHGAGYNWLCPVDSDSTAWAILFLHACGETVSDDLYDTLLERQNPDGGFATYGSRLFPPGHSWTCSHPDVTPVVLRALLTRFEPSHSAVRAGLDYVMRSHIRWLWPSFWWTTLLYSTCMNLALLSDVVPCYDRRPIRAALEAHTQVDDPFAQALMTEAIAFVDPSGTAERLRQIVGLLCASQDPDGGWRSSAVLRLTHADCPRPWLRGGHAGDLYPDQNRLLTTSTVLSALVRAADGARHD